MRAVSSAAMLTWASSLSLKLSAKHSWIMHTHLRKVLQIFQNCTDFCHGPPVVAHMQSSTWPLKQTGRDQEKPIDFWICRNSLWQSVWKKHASTNRWITIWTVIHSSACIWYLLPASLLYSCSPNYADYPTLKLNFPNCYINIKIHI